jgi:(S)-citramalyl-CoA lyase
MTNQTLLHTRGWLFTPATRPERFAKALAVSADVLIIDLEDAVAPADKDSARTTALKYLAAPGEGGIARALRVNALDTAAGLADLSGLLASPAVPDFIVLPKTESAAHLRILDNLLTRSGKAARLVGLIESAAGLAAVETIAKATQRLCALMFGAADMAADLGAATAWEPLYGARSHLVAACAQGGVLAIDAPFFNVRDEVGLKQEVATAVALGFGAKAAIHPTQIAAINAALTPTAAAVEKARSILAENAKGVGTIDGQMIDEAIARKARRILAAAGLEE